MTVLNLIKNIYNLKKSIFVQDKTSVRKYVHLMLIYTNSFYNKYVKSQFIQ